MIEEKSDSKGLSTRIIKASMAVFVAHALFKVAGLALNIFLKAKFDTAVFESVYVVAFESVIFSLFLIGEELIGPALLPIFSQVKQEQGETKAWALAMALLCLQGVLLVAVGFGLYAFSDSVISYLTYWEVEGDGAKSFSLASEAVRYMSPALLFMSLASTTYIVLNAYKRFFLAAFADAAFKYGVLIFAAVGMYFWGEMEEAQRGARAIVLGIVCGACFKLLTHLIGLWPQRVLFFSRPDWRTAAFRQLLWLMLPLLFGILLAKARDIYNAATVLSSLDMPGLITANFFGRKLFLTIGWLVPYALSIAMFPFFCEMSSRDDKQGLSDVLVSSGRMMLAVFVPLSLVLVVLSPTLVQLMQMGKFTAQEIQLSGVSMACYVLVLPAYSLEFFLMQAFFSERKMWSVILIGAVFSMLTIGISYVGIRQMDIVGAGALMVVALGYVFSRTGKVLTLTLMMNRHISLGSWSSHAVFMLRLLCIGGICAAVTWGMLEGTTDLIVGKLGIVFALGLSCGVVGLVYLLLCRMLCVAEVFDMFNWAKAKIRDKRKR